MIATEDSGSTATRRGSTATRRGSTPTRLGFDPNPPGFDRNPPGFAPDPAEIGANGAEVSDTKFKAIGLIGSDPDQHARKIKAMEQLGATAIVIINVSSTDPLGMLCTYGEHVLPKLRSR